MLFSERMYFLFFKILKKTILCPNNEILQPTDYGLVQFALNVTYFILKFLF